MKALSVPHIRRAAPSQSMFSAWRGFLVEQANGGCSVSGKMFGGGGQDRTADLGVMNPIEIDDSKEDIAVNSAESGDLRQSLQPPRNQVVDATTPETGQVGESDRIQIQDDLSH